MAEKTEKEYPFDLSTYEKVYRDNPQAFTIVEVLKREDGTYKDLFFVYANEAYERVSGFKVKDLIGHTYTEVMAYYTPMQDWSDNQWVELYGPVAWLGETVEKIAPSAEIEPGVMHYVNVQAFRIEEGYAGINVVDVTSRISSEEKRLRRVYETIINKANLFIWEEDLVKGTFYKVDSRNTTGEVIAMEDPFSYMSEHTDDEGRGIIKKLFDDVKIGIQGTGTIRFFPADDSLEPGFFMLMMSPTLDKDGNIVGIFGITQDITEQHKVQEQLNRYLSDDNQILERIVLETNEFIAVLDLEADMGELRHGTWFDAGSALPKNINRVKIPDIVEVACRALKKDAEKQRFRDIMNKDNIERTLKEKGSFSATFDFTEERSDLVRKMFRFISLDKEKKLVLCIKNDVTDSYKKEMQLKKALEAAEEANAAKLNFISRISHDIRTPLAAVKSMTEFAFQDIHDEEKIRHDLENIHNSSEFLNSLINDILDVSKIDSGQVEMHPEPYSFSNYKDELEGIVTAEAKKKGVKIEFINDGQDVRVLTDPIRWRQMSFNVIMNAIKYTPEGGSVKIEYGGKPLPDGRALCKIIVTDTGIGMSENFLKRVFTPFQQDNDNPERRKIGGGTGLGLYIVKRLTELMGGAVEINSEVGKGTKVAIFIILPVVKEDGAPVSGQKAKSAADMKLSGRALLFEDNPINTEIAKRILSSIGIEVEHAGNGKEGVDMFAAAEEGHFDIVLMDIQMPLMNGYEATRAIRAIDRPDAKTVPIIAMTADAFENAKQMAFDAGVNDYITKPLDMMKVKRTVAELLQK